MTAICLSITICIVFYDLLELSYPELTLSSDQYERYQSDDSFKLSMLKEQKDIKNLDIPKLREEGYPTALKIEQRDALQSLIQSAIIVLVNAILFVFHWFLAKKVKKY